MCSTALTDGLVTSRDWGDRYVRVTYDACALCHARDGCDLALFSSVASLVEMAVIVPISASQVAGG